MLPKETHLRTKDLNRLKLMSWGKVFQAIGQRKRAGATILISDKIEFKTKAIERHTEVHFMLLKQRVYQEAINIVNICTPNIRAPKYIRKILDDFKKDNDSNTLIVGDFYTHCQQ